jgi:hypothetical protein
MRIVCILVAVTTCTALSACAGFSPKADELAKVPHIEFGQPLPQGNDYALLFPASAVLPVTTSVDGNILEHDDQATIPDSLKRNVYANRQFVCFDSVDWLMYGRLRDIRLEVQIPLKDGSNECFVHVKVAEKRYQ